MKTEYVLPRFDPGWYFNRRTLCWELWSEGRRRAYVGAEAVISREGKVSYHYILNLQGGRAPIYRELSERSELGGK